MKKDSHVNVTYAIFTHVIYIINFVPFFYLIIAKVTKANHIDLTDTGFEPSPHKWEKKCLST